MYLLVVRSYHDHNPHQPPEHQRNHAVALALSVFGYWWFAKSRRNFADVI